jgi:hypothetical protein
MINSLERKKDSEDSDDESNEVIIQNILKVRVEPKIKKQRSERQKESLRKARRKKSEYATLRRDKKNKTTVEHSDVEHSDVENSSKESNNILSWDDFLF